MLTAPIRLASTKLAPRAVPAVPTALLALGGEALISTTKVPAPTQAAIASPTCTALPTSTAENTMSQFATRSSRLPTVSAPSRATRFLNGWVYGGQFLDPLQYTRIRSKPFALRPFVKHDAASPYPTNPTVACISFLRPYYMCFFGL